MDFRALAVQDARRFGLDPNVFLRQINQESGFNPNAMSGAGAVGIAQIVPRYHPGVNARDPVASLQYAAKYMAGLVHQYGGSYAKALSVYNSGRPDAYLDPRFAGGQTFNYVRSILGAGGAAALPAPPAAENKQIPSPPSAGGLSPLAASIVSSNDQILGIPAPPALAQLALGQARLGQTPPSIQPQPGQTPVPKGSTVSWLERFASPFGLAVTSTTGGKHAPNSFHYRGRAVDFGGNPQKMAQLAGYALQHPGQFQEMFYTGPGHPGYFISRGQVLPLNQLDRGLYVEHENHVHLAR